MPSPSSNFDYISNPNILNTNPSGIWRLILSPYMFDAGTVTRRVDSFPGTMPRITDIKLHVKFLAKGNLNGPDAWRNYFTTIYGDGS